MSKSMFMYRLVNHLVPMDIDLLEHVSFQQSTIGACMARLQHLFG